MINVVWLASYSTLQILSCIYASCLDKCKKNFCIVGLIQLLVADRQLYKRLCPFVRLLVCRSGRGHKSKSGKTRISAPAHLSTTFMGRVSGLVFSCVLRDSTPRYVGRSVGRSVGWLVGWSVGRLVPFLLFQNFQASSSRSMGSFNKSVWWIPLYLLHLQDILIKIIGIV